MPEKVRTPRVSFASHEEHFEAQPVAVRPILEWIRTTTESVVPALAAEHGGEEK